MSSCKWQLHVRAGWVGERTNAWNIKRGEYGLKGLHICAGAFDTFLNVQITVSGGLLYVNTYEEMILCLLLAAHQSPLMQDI